MSKLIFQFTIILCFISINALSEDVILTIKGRHQENIIQLDSFLVENLTNQSSIWITNLPEHYSQDLNLAIGSLTGISEKIENDNIRIVENNPGTIKFQVYAQSLSKTKISIFNLNGQKIYQTSSNISAGFNQIAVNIGFPGMYIVQIIQDDKTNSAKVYGNPIYATNVTFSKSIQIENKSGSLSKNDDFSFSTNDEIQITAFAKDVKSEPIKKVVFESQEFICDFIDSDTCGLFVDTRDTTAYKWIKLGEQVWMAENLSYKCDSGFKQPEDPELSKIYGGYYNYETAKSNCPAGWHLPTDQEWEQLAEFISNTKGPFTKNKDGWNNIGEFIKADYGWEHEANGNDEFKFKGLPGGTTSLSSESYNMMGKMGLWWSATDTTENYAFSRMVDESSFFRRAQTGKLNLINVRCVKNKEEAPALTQNINKFIYEVLKDVYLWNDQVPEIDFKYETNPEKYFKSLLFEADNTSKITEDVEKLKRESQGIKKSIGYSLTLTKSETNNQYYAIVEFVYPHSAASLAGLKRGSVISHINYEPINNDNFSELLSSDSLTITTALFSNNNVTQESTIELIATTQEFNPVLIQKTIAIDDHKIGYLFYTNFLTSAKEQLDSALYSFYQNEITDLIIDLRYNTGGHAPQVQYLCSSIAPIENLNNENILVTQNWNNQYQQFFEENNVENALEITFDRNVNFMLDFSRVYFLIGNKTAAASEITIAGLSDYMDVITIGDSTSGNYLGSLLFEPGDYYNDINYYKDFNNWGIQPVVIRFGDKQNGDLPEGGLTPDYQVADNPLSEYKLGDVNEPLLKKSIEEITKMAINNTKNADSNGQIKLINQKQTEQQNSGFQIPFNYIFKNRSIK
ncbi:FISUMP domain-containing protein [uncultured Draconibacterium sp.]|uniref:FISUMP domain-containing protein n=1 Tax=uncultured Draconibacterium sp. TaxID=1573823 RepID=UPI002AA8D094|nr:FISUMP domain-containing protein [uncultured Draconibacterium sp.]